MKKIDVILELSAMNNKLNVIIANQERIITILNAIRGSANT